MAVKKPRKGLTEQQKLYVKMVINGMQREEIMLQLFGIDIKTADKKVVNRYDQTLWRWRQLPEYDKEWKKCWRDRWGKLTYQAMGVIEEGMQDSALPWRRTQSANLAISYGQKAMAGEEAGVIKVQVMGMPELGSPEAPESDVESGET